MPNAPAGETKKAICRAFTKIVKTSRLQGSIDPKAFFMMMNTNYAMLHREGAFDLNPLWEALAASHSPAVLRGIFLKFAESAADKGLEPVLPPDVAALTQDQREHELRMFDPAGQVMDVVTGESGSHPSIDALPVLDDSALDLQLSTGDLKPFIPEETQRQITQHVVNALKSAPIGQSLDAHQLAFLVDSNFADLFNGQQFDVNPMLDGLREMQAFQDEDAYAAIVRLEQKLHGMGYSLAPVSLNIDPTRAEQLIAEAEERDRQMAQEAANAIARSRGDVSQVPAIEPNVADEEKSDSNKTTRQDRQAKKYGIKRKGLSKTALLVRAGVLGVILIGTGVGALLTWPDRALSTERFSTTIPMTAAELKDGGLQGTLDDHTWWKIPFDERTLRIESFRKYATSKGFTRGLQVRDQQNRVVLSATNDGRIIAANFFEFGKSDGTIDESQLDRMMERLPSSVQAAIKNRQERAKKKAEEQQKKGLPPPGGSVPPPPPAPPN